jgi:choline dehydrogenase-like flavoprotein
MSLSELVPSNSPAPFDVQSTAFSHDVLGRYVCNTWEEVDAAQKSGGYPFDVVVIGAGMFGAYIAEKLYRKGADDALRILVLDAGAFLFPTHIQNLPQRVGGKIGGADAPRTRDNGTQNVVWGMPWISNAGFPGLAYCLGGRSLFWGGWSPQLTDDDLAQWPTDVCDYLRSTEGYEEVEKEIGVVPSTDFIQETDLYTALLNAFQSAKASVPSVTLVREAPLAVQGSAPESGVFPFDKFSSAPFFIDAVRDDVATNTGGGDVTRRLFFVPRAQVRRLVRTGDAVTGIELGVNGQPKTVTLAPGCAVVIANGTIESTRLALESLGVGSTQFGSPRVGNLMAHLRSNITVRIKRTALGLAKPTVLETAALIVRGSALDRRFHIQVTSASVAGDNPEINMWSMVPDIDLLGGLIAKQDPDWVTVTLRCIGEMEDGRTLSPDPAKSWVDLSSEGDGHTRRAYVNLVATQNDRNLWSAMDAAAFDLAARIAQSASNIQYWNAPAKAWSTARPQPDGSGRGFWQDGLGTTHHEAGTLFMGAPGSSFTNTSGRVHDVDNAYIAGPALFPTLGSANPSLTALALARRTADAIVTAAGAASQPEFEPLSLDPKHWQMVRRAGTPDANVRHHGKVLETSGGYGLYWYVKEELANFVLRVEWRVARRDDNSGIYLRTPPPSTSGALDAADSQGHEVQIDERGYDSATNTEGVPSKMTGAIYDVQAPTAFASRPIGEWNTFEIEADGPSIRVTLNGVLVAACTSTRRSSGYVALQAHHAGSRAQFRNLAIRKLA